LIECSSVAGEVSANQWIALQEPSNPYMNCHPEDLSSSGAVL
jgi:hypothetical protein